MVADQKPDPVASQAHPYRGRTAVVTGAGSGIGRAIAELLAEKGATVALADRDLDAASAVADGIMTRRGIAQAFLVDVSNTESIVELARRVHEWAGTAQLLTN